MSVFSTWMSAFSRSLFVSWDRSWIGGFVVSIIIFVFVLIEIISPTLSEHPTEWSKGERNPCPIGNKRFEIYCGRKSSLMTISNRGSTDNILIVFILQILHKTAWNNGASIFKEISYKCWEHEALNMLMLFDMWRPEKIVVNFLWACIIITY